VALLTLSKQHKEKQVVGAGWNIWNFCCSLRAVVGAAARARGFAAV
jgi:hypothetical protein